MRAGFHQLQRVLRDRQHVDGTRPLRTPQEGRNRTRWQTVRPACQDTSLPGKAASPSPRSFPARPLAALLSQPDGTSPGPLFQDSAKENLFCLAECALGKPAPLPLPSPRRHNHQPHQKRPVLPDLDTPQPALSKDCHVIAKLDFLLLE